MNRMAAFSLIELMIVIAIIGILSGIAIPAYNDYSMRSKLATVVAEMAKARAEVALYVQTNGTHSGLPAELQAGGGTYYTSVLWWEDASSIANKDFIIFPVLDTSVFSYAGVTTPRIYFYGNYSSGTLEWTCGYDERAELRIPQAHFPANCDNNVYPDMIS